MSTPKKYKNEIIRFETGSPVTLVLDTEPSSVQAKKVSGNYGDFDSYTYYCVGNKMFFATWSLHNQLINFHKGDTVTIQKDSVGNKVEWNVSGNSSQSSPSENNDAFKMKVLQELSKISSRLDTLEKHIYGGKTENKIPNFEDEDNAEEVNDENLF